MLEKTKKKENLIIKKIPIPKDKQIPKELLTPKDKPILKETLIPKDKLNLKEMLSHKEMKLLFQEYEEELMLIWSLRACSTRSSHYSFSHSFS